jgi:hypothetical protein
MLNNRCELIGVTSRNCGDDGDCSIHTNITNDSNRNWLLSQIKDRNAQICGLPGTNNSYCPASGTAVVDRNPQKESDGTAGFPCAPGPAAGGQSLPDDGKLKIGLTAAASGAFQMHVSIPGEGMSVSACANVQEPSQCTSSLSGQYFASRKIRQMGSRGIFQIQRGFSANDAAATWTLVGRDSTGAIKQVRKFKLSQ